MTKPKYNRCDYCGRSAHWENYVRPSFKVEPNVLYDRRAHKGQS